MLLAKTPSVAFVTGLGIGTVFVGLVCIVILCMIMSAVVNLGTKNKKDEKSEIKAPAQPAAPAKAQIANKQEFIAAVSAAIAEDMGTDITGIRILSVKQL